jgi:hypothetical protein
LVVRAGFAQQEQIPKELALALVPFGGTDGGEIIVGQMPPDLATAFALPPGGRVLGSFVSLTVAQVAMTFPGSTDSALAFVSRSLVTHGWTARQLTPRRGGLQFGMPRTAAPRFFCKTGSPDAINVAAQFHGTGTTLLRITRNTGSSSCEAPQSLSATASSGAGALERVEFVQMQMREEPLAAVPPLWAPTDYRASQVCQQQSTRIVPETQNQPLRTEMSPAQILAYYGHQLDSAGWKPFTASDASVSGTWTDTVTKGDAHEVTITVTKLPGQLGCYDVSLRALKKPMTR